MNDRDQTDPTGWATPAASESEGGSDDGPIERITGESRSLFDDLKGWVDLKIQLIQLDFEDRIRQAANQAALTAVVIVVGLLSFLFGLVAAGEALGAWFDSRSLGYLTLSAALLLIAVVIHLTKPRLVDRAEVEHDVNDDHDLLSDGTDGPPALPEAVSARPPESSDRTSDADEGDRRPNESRPDPLSAPTSDEHR